MTKDTKMVSIRLPTDLWDDIEALAARQERSTSGEIRVALREHLDRTSGARL